VLSLSKDTPLYNSRLLSVYLKLLRDKYPEVEIGSILTFAGIEPYEVRDEGCWFTQEQVDRFYEKAAQLSGNKNIAREAGRLAASPGTIGALRQHTFGLLSPSFAFKVIDRLSKNLTRSSDYRSRKIRNNQVELIVKPYAGVEEKIFQCENRIGFFEAIVVGFQLGLPRVEHPECLFKGGARCRYLITWKRTLSNIFGNIRNLSLALLALSLGPGLFIFPSSTFLFSSGSLLVLFLTLSLLTEFIRRQEMTRSMENLWDSSERLTHLIDSSSRNVQLVNEVGQALVHKKSVEDVLHAVSQVMESGLDFDCGAILLANTEQTRLEVRSAFGYSFKEINRLTQAGFSLDKPDSQGPFVQAFYQKKPFIIDDTGDIKEKLSAKSRLLVEMLNVHSFLCCPIVVDNQALGVIAVTNQTTKRPLTRSDVNLLQGITPTIGVALQNAGLIEKLNHSFERTLKVLADSIDARDYLTAGHSEVVTEYAAGIAKEMGQSEEYIQMIRIASLLHDYGKIGVPDAILKKNGSLTPEERDIINTHPARTQQILNQVLFRGIHTQIPQITGAHHERWDGAGYPSGLKQEEIPLGARILAVADFFEATTAKRHYREPIPVPTVLGLLRESSGTHFDPRVVKAFLTYLENREFALIRSGARAYAFGTSSGSRRQSPRAEYRTQVSARQGRCILSGDTLNIGAKGVFIVSEDKAQDKTLIILTFTFPGKETYLQVLGRVAWINAQNNPVSSNHPQGFAVCFQELPEQALAAINQFIRQQIVPVSRGRNRKEERPLEQS
jgi:HD-GYP domain-containing protein (c-di-GMP phosphodiesterase class II)